MADTSDRLPTSDTESPAVVGRVPDLRLSPRLAASRVESRTTLEIRPESRGQTGTNAPRVSGRFGVVSDETSDRLPTEPSRTSDTAGHRHGGEAASTLHRQLDHRLRLRLAQLEVLPGAISGKGVEQTSASSEKSLPITLSGKAKGVDPESDVYLFRLRIERAHSVKAKAAVLKDLIAARDAIIVSRRKGRPEFDLSVKEGRIAAGQLAETHGVRWACQALGGVPERTMRRYRDEARRSGKADK